MFESDLNCCDVKIVYDYFAFEWKYIVFVCLIKTWTIVYCCSFVRWNVCIYWASLKQMTHLHGTQNSGPRISMNFKQSIIYLHFEFDLTVQWREIYEFIKIQEYFNTGTIEYLRQRHVFREFFFSLSNLTVSSSTNSLIIYTWNYVHYTKEFLIFAERYLIPVRIDDNKNNNIIMI